MYFHDSIVMHLKKKNQITFGYIAKKFSAQDKKKKIIGIM